MSSVGTKSETASTSEAPWSFRATLSTTWRYPVFSRDAQEENFRNFERFFLKQISELGYEAVLQKYLVGDDEVADDMLCRIYHG